MKRLLMSTILLLAIVIGCNKEKSLISETAQDSKQSLNRGFGGSYSKVKDYMIRNDFYTPGYGYSYLAPALKNNEVWLYIGYHPVGEYWTMEYANGFLKGDIARFSPQDTYLGKSGSLDINWGSPQEEKEAVISPPSSRLRQYWRLIGEKKYAEDGKTLDSFKGVIVNAANNKMLKVGVHYVVPGYVEVVLASKIYAGSDEQKHYSKYGNFDRFGWVGQEPSASTIWNITRSK
ncbi:MAG: hypothetical protein ACQPRJ_06605 [Solitalea-like symbiont of Acarus siro]